MSNISLQIERLNAGSIGSSQNVIFDSTVLVSGNISYDALTGVITLSEPGRYEFDWWVATQSSAAGNVGFTLVSSGGVSVIGNSPIKTGEVVGVAVLEVSSDDVPVTVALRNNNTETVFLSAAVPVKASLAVIGDSESLGNAATTIPFSLGKYGLYLYTNEQGNPVNVGFSGFGIAGEQYITLTEGDWDAGVITFTENMQYGTSFIVPYNTVLKKIYVVFSTGEYHQFSEGAVIQPFVCIGTADPESEELVYTILQDTLTYTGTYEGGIEYPKHTLRWGSLTNLNVALQEGTLVAIIVGILAENTEEPQYGRFAISGGLYLE